METFKSPENKKLTLEEQFNNPEVLELAGEKIEVHDIAPDNLKSEVPVIFAPGWSGTPKAYEDNIFEIAKAGRRVISVNAPHGVKNHNIESGEVGGQAGVELGKLAAIMEALDKKGIEKVDAVGHSEAGIFVTLAAAMNPEKFRNIVFANPAGMIGKDNAARLSLCFSLEMVKQTISGMRRKDVDRPSLKPGGAMAPIKVLLSNPGASLRSVLAMGNADLRDMLVSIREKGTKISIIHGVEDLAFPMDRMQEVLDKSHVDGFYSVKGGHNAPILSPRIYTHAINQALDALENKSS